jgi:acyl-coenzyme A synthetase/AMP-(fatty) acid ligase
MAIGLWRPINIPRAVEFVDSLPMTATGKIMRRKLRERAASVGKVQPSPESEG